MKNILLLSLIMFIVGLSGCQKINELPPKTDDTQTNYLPPKGVPSTLDERNYVKARLNEYNTAVGN